MLIEGSVQSKWELPHIKELYNWKAAIGGGG